MANYGFVYCLGHDLMPGVFKIGMTDRSPSKRCEEISSSTGVPGPFDVLFFIEVEEPRSVERAMHNFFSAERVCAGREFFECDIRIIHRAFKVYQEEGFAYAETNTGGAALHFAYSKEPISDERAFNPPGPITEIDVGF